MKQHFTQCIGALGCALLAACSSTDTSAGGYLFKPEVMVATARELVSDGYWDCPEGLSGEHLIVVDTERQKATYYIGGKQVGISAIASGKAGHGTPKGTFSILAKDINHKSSTYGSIVDAKGNTLIADYTVGQPRPANGIYKGAEMNFGMQITRTGIWMHEGIVTSAPESHGCIRLPRKMAQIFFENTPVGARVIIK